MYIYIIHLVFVYISRVIQVTVVVTCPDAFSLNYQINIELGSLFIRCCRRT